MSDVPPGLYTAQLDASEAITTYVNRLRRTALRVEAIGREVSRLLYVIEDPNSYPSDKLASIVSIESLGIELHDLAMIAHTADFKQLHHVLQP